jgi:HlyD family secretion protein
LKKRIVLIIFFVLLAGVGTMVYYGQQKNQNKALYYSGSIEATKADLAFQIGGKVANVLVREGETVEKDQLLAELDASELESRMIQAKANLDLSQKNKEQVEIVFEMYKTSLPAEVERAKAGLSITRNVMADAKKNYERYAELYKKGVATEKEWDTVRLAYENAESGYKEAEAALTQAVSNLDKIDAASKDIHSAQSKIDAAMSALEQTAIQLRYAKLKAPMKGVIVSRNVEPGEVVTPGREVLSLADLSRVDLKIFVAETEIGKVIPGQEVDVKVDTFPDKVFKGKVAFISPESEFTPKTIETHKERVKLVYLVKVSIQNNDYYLKSGMPADAYFK